MTQIGHYGQVILRHLERNDPFFLVVDGTLEQYVSDLEDEMREEIHRRMEEKLSRYVLPEDGNPEPRLALIAKYVHDVEQGVYRDILYARHKEPRPFDPDIDDNPF